MARRVEYGLVRVDMNGRIRIPDQVLKYIKQKFGVSEVRFRVEYDEDIDEVRLIPIKEAKVVTVKGEVIELL